ncbi:hypothetical protein ACYT86_25525 [Pseudomonas idahonensis]
MPAKASVQALHEFARQSDTVAFASAISGEGQGMDGLVSVPLSNPRLGDRDIQVLTMPKRVLPESLAFFIDTLIARLQKED